MGAGKSEVARILASFGAYVIDTDKLAREAVAPGSDGLREISRVWPSVVQHSALDRGALAQIVFHDPQARARLNAIVHPHVRRLALERERYAEPGRPVVHVVPLLFETGYTEMIDASILVVAPEEQRIARVACRDGLGEEQIRARMAAQIDPAQARKLATYVIENDGDLSRLKMQVKAVYDDLLAAKSEERDR